jgi:hypothetical protein
MATSSFVRVAPRSKTAADAGKMAGRARFVQIQEANRPARVPASSRRPHRNRRLKMTDTKKEPRQPLPIAVGKASLNPRLQSIRQSIIVR